MHGEPQAALSGGRRAALPSRWSFPELVAPLPLAAAALLAVNDTWLKAAFHNEITGKLSDVAVCFVLPLYLSALLGLLLPRLPLPRRLAAGSLVAAGLFTLLELSPGAADRFCVANAWIGSFIGITGPCRLTSDPTDLLTLVFVPLAYLYGLKTGATRR